MTPDVLPIGSIVRCDYYGRGIFVDGSRSAIGTLFHVRWDKPIVWNESPMHKAETYQSCWVDDIDVEIVSEAKCG